MYEMKQMWQFILTFSSSAIELVELVERHDGVAGREAAWRQGTLRRVVLAPSQDTRSDLLSDITGSAVVNILGCTL